VTDAVAASCAIPGLFRPVRIGRHWYIDGGAHSTTNADVLVDAGVDAAIVLAPMSARRGAAGRRPDRGVRALFRRRLAREIATLHAAGIDTEVFEPSADTLRAMGWNALDRSRVPAVVSSAFLSADVGRFAHEPGTTVLNRLRPTAHVRRAS
jgi:NTE family protein